MDLVVYSSDTSKVLHVEAHRKSDLKCLKTWTFPKATAKRAVVEIEIDDPETTDIWCWRGGETYQVGDLFGVVNAAKVPAVELTVKSRVYPRIDLKDIVPETGTVEVKVLRDSFAGFPFASKYADEDGKLVNRSDKVMEIDRDTGMTLVLSRITGSIIHDGHFLAKGRFCIDDLDSFEDKVLYNKDFLSNKHMMSGNASYAFIIGEQDFSGKFTDDGFVRNEVQVATFDLDVVNCEGSSGEWEYIIPNLNSVQYLPARKAIEFNIDDSRGFAWLSTVVERRVTVRSGGSETVKRSICHNELSQLPPLFDRTKKLTLPFNKESDRASISLSAGEELVSVSYLAYIKLADLMSYEFALLTMDFSQNWHEETLQREYAGPVEI